MNHKKTSPRPVISTSSHKDTWWKNTFSATIKAVGHSEDNFLNSGHNPIELKEEVKNLLYSRR
jgi:hypothetical protein